METELTTTQSDNQIDRLLPVLESLEQRIKRQNSLKYALARGMVYGVGTVIGASILVALFGGILASTTNLLSNQTDFINEQLAE